MQMFPDLLKASSENVPVPGPLYPDRCPECAEILREGYGCGQSARCAECLAADVHKIAEAFASLASALPLKADVAAVGRESPKLTRLRHCFLLRAL